ncbi:hypothetical protein ACSMXN_22785 [Jatrophihabitans sp. DSM 45814]
MQIKLFDAAEVSYEDPGTPVPIKGLPTRTVIVADGMTVSDVLIAGDFMGASSFALLTGDLADDVRSGQRRTVAFAHNLFGLTADGALVAEQSTQTLWADFFRAVQAGIYQGDPSHLVVYAYGTAGGSGLNEWVETAQTIWDAHEEIGFAIGTLTGVATFTEWLRKKIASREGRRLRSTGRPSRAMELWAQDQAQFSTESFAEHFRIPTAEAAAALRGLGLQRGLDDLWRPLSPQILVSMNDWIANCDAFSARAFSEVFNMPDVEARLLLYGFGCRVEPNGLWHHKP